MKGQAGSIPEILLFPIGILVSGWKVAPYEHSTESGINSSAVGLPGWHHLALPAVFFTGCPEN